MINIALYNFSDSEKRLFDELAIQALILFGSQAQGLANEKSDFDIGVILGDKKLLYNEEARRVIYNFIYDILADHIKELKNIDIVFLDMAPEELKSHVLKYGKVLYESKPGIFADFKAEIIQQYADFAPLREIFHKGILSQIR